ncbi:hypothetical protein CVT26_007635 [Gymnopilus dilepis]|uniref:Uncharacterized protein n=1 Tax=Gymnopilus dilepis TaxID=231916 RepID=A0A409VZQ2_9AGAR|nr:hypothetical protein CVT26_007635 [Gymnopilus dilepis]
MYRKWKDLLKMETKAIFKFIAPHVDKESQDIASKIIKGGLVTTFKGDTRLWPHRRQDAKIQIRLDWGSQGAFRKADQGCDGGFYQDFNLQINSEAANPTLRRLVAQNPHYKYLTAFVPTTKNGEVELSREQLDLEFKGKFLPKLKEGLPLPTR